MGLQKRNTNVTFLNLKEGKIYESTDKEKTNPYDEIEGQITGMSFRDDEFEGQKIRKLNVTLTDGEQDYVLSTKTDSSYFSSLISFLKNADLAKPLTLVPFYKVEKDGKSKLGILVKQNGSFLKSYYTKDNPNGLPAFNKVVVSGKTLWDKTDYLAFLESVIVNELKPTLVKVEENQDGPRGLVTGSTPAASAAPVMVEASADDIADDLPF